MDTVHTVQSWPIKAVRVPFAFLFYGEYDRYVADLEVI